MKLADLRNFDLVVLRDGSLGIVLEKDNDVFILYQEGGYDDADEIFDEDLKDYCNGPEYDIMQVYRTDCCGILCDVTYEDDGDLIFERDENWVRPSEEEREKIRKERREALERERAAELEKARERRKNLITVMAQAFYGNRTITETTPESMDALVLGYLDRKLCNKERIDRTIVPIPGSDKVVLVYNKNQEEEYRKDRKEQLREMGRDMKPMACIPEKGITLYSRCLACRIDETGTLQSLHPEDCKLLFKYLAE